MTAANSPLRPRTALADFCAGRTACAQAGAARLWPDAGLHAVLPEHHRADPLSALIFKTFTLTWDQFWAAISAPRVLASYRLTFGASFIAALVNLVFGLLIAWVLVRYKFPGKKIVDALVDLPFALPTAVAGISLTALLAGNGWMGSTWSPWASSWRSSPRAS
jgi:ABC-type sulfate transport system permease component